MNNKYTGIAIAVVIAMVLAILLNIKRKKINQELIEAIKKDDEKAFNAIIERFTTKMLISPFNVDYMRLNYAFIRNDAKRIVEMLDAFEKKRLNRKQAKDIYSKAFNYYLSIENKNGAKHWLDKVHELNDSKMTYEFDTIYDVYLEKGWKFLDEMLEDLETTDDVYKGPTEFLISLMYENKGDKNKAKEFRARSEKSMVLLDRKLKADAERKNKK